MPPQPSVKVLKFVASILPDSGDVVALAMGESAKTSRLKMSFVSVGPVCIWKGFGGRGARFGVAYTVIAELVVASVYDGPALRTPWLPHLRIEYPLQCYPFAHFNAGAPVTVARQHVSLGL